MSTSGRLWAVLALVAAAACEHRVAAEEPATPAPALHFHHVHLNSSNPAGAADYYAKAIPGATRERVAGFEAVKTNKIYLLFTKVKTRPPATPDTALWHFGWIFDDSRKQLERFKAMGLKTIPMYTDGADGPMVDISSDTYPGTLTRTQLAEAKAKGVQPARTAGYEYLEGPDGVLWENNGNGPVHLDHLHLFHEHPICAQEWYIAKLGATRPPPRGGGPPQAPTGDCKLPYGEPGWPALAKRGFVRQPFGRTLVDDVGFYIVPRPTASPLVPTRGHAIDHMALSVPDLDAILKRLKSEGVTVLEGIHPWGTTRAAMIEGPDHVAIELLEQK